jgi:HD-GYP domain-containing protein (c-di-GMP phosphodiesterase class II)
MKKGSLTDEEWEVMKQHTVHGAQHLLDTSGVPRLAVVIAFEHHMKYDGTGYPQVPAGWRQNIFSQMTAISDCFDALRTIRPYQASVDYPEIAATMQRIAGTSLHPGLTRNFLSLLNRSVSH